MYLCVRVVIERIGYIMVISCIWCEPNTASQPFGLSSLRIGSNDLPGSLYDGPFALDQSSTVGAISTQLTSARLVRPCGSPGPATISGRWTPASYKFVFAPGK